MFDAIRATWKQATTEGDNATKCPVRLGSIGVALIYHAAAVWMVFGQHVTVDMGVLGAYVQHMCYLIGTAAGAIGVKAVLKGDAQ